MGHIAYLKNQFKSMKTFERSYDYKYYKIGQVVQKEMTFKFRECTCAIWLLSPDVKRCGLTKILFTQGCFLPSLVGPMVQQKRTFNFLLVCNYLPLEKCVVLYRINLYTLHSRMFCAKKDFLNSSLYFCNFVIISPQKRECPSFE